MTVLVRRLALAAGVALSLASGVAAWAGGDDYDATAEAAEDKGPSYFGFVRDVRGIPVSEARVILRPKAGDGVEVKTNVLGLYRSHVTKEADPKDVEVSCDKTGYRQTRVFRRTAPGSGARVIETDCTLQRL